MEQFRVDKRNEWWMEQGRGLANHKNQSKKSNTD